MRNLFSKFLQESTEQKNEELESDFPKLNHLDSYQKVQHRALIGWIVSRFAAALELNEKEREAMFFMSFTTESLKAIENALIRDLMLLAESAIQWIQNNAVMEEELKVLNPTFSSKEVLGRVLNEIQSDVKGQQESFNETEKAWEIYRDVIYSATHGRFLLIKKNELSRYKKGDLLCEVAIEDRKDISKARNLAKEAFEEKGLSPSKIMSYSLIISEAVTNILKHANNGKMRIYLNGEVFHVLVEDTGTGFPLKLLPKTTLMAGFSTKESLGQGFTLMMKMADQVVLETSSSGSSLILLLNPEKG